MNTFNYNVDSFWSDKQSRRYKGGGSQTGYQRHGPEQAQAATIGMAQAKDMLYPLVTNAVKGRGFGTLRSVADSTASRHEGLDASFETARSESESQMARTLRPEDTRSKEFVSSTLSRAYTTSKDNLNRTIRAEKVSDKSMGMDMAATMLANEQRIGVGNAESYNAALAKNMATANTMGTYQSNLASGAGEGMMDAYYANQMSNQQ